MQTKEVKGPTWRYTTHRAVGTGRGKDEAKEKQS